MFAKEHQRKQKNKKHDNGQSKLPMTEDWVGEHNSITETRKEKLLQFEAKHKELAEAYVTAHESYITNIYGLIESARNALKNTRISYNSAILKIMEKRQSESKKAEEKAKPKLDEIQRKFETDMDKAQTPIEKAQVTQTRKRQMGRALNKKEFKQASDSPEADEYKCKVGDRLAKKRKAITKERTRLQEIFDNSTLKILKEQESLRDEMDKESFGDRMLAEQDPTKEDQINRKEEIHSVLALLEHFLMKDLVTFALEEKDEM